MGGTHFFGWIPGLHQKENVCWVHAFTVFCFLTAHTMWPCAPHSCPPALSLGTVPQSSEPKQNLSPKICFCPRILSQQHKKQLRHTDSCIHSQPEFEDLRGKSPNLIKGIAKLALYVLHNIDETPRLWSAVLFSILFRSAYSMYLSSFPICPDYIWWLTFSYVIVTESVVTVSQGWVSSNCYFS